jgi:hypothetical protein
MTWVKRIVLFAIFATIVETGLTPFKVAMFAVLGVNQSPQQRALVLSSAAISVSLIFLASALVLWILARFGGPLKGEVDAVIKTFGGSVWLTAAGIVGGFLAVIIVGVAGAYLLSR